MKDRGIDEHIVVLLVDKKSKCQVSPLRLKHKNGLDIIPHRDELAGTLITAVAEDFVKGEIEIKHMYGHLDKIANDGDFYIWKDCLIRKSTTLF